MSLFVEAGVEEVEGVGVEGECWGRGLDVRIGV